MKRHWQIQHQTQPTADGARRWDQAYQYLLGWTAPHRLHVGSTPTPLHRPQTEDMYKNTAIYARVSTERQTLAQTIESRVARLTAHVASQGETLRTEDIFRDDGYRGATLNRLGFST